MPVLTGDVMMACDMDYDSIAKAGSMLGSGAVTPFNTTRDPVTILESIARFYAHESCGQCTPCREGTGYVNRILQKVAAGQGRDGDIELMKDLAESYEWTTICAFAPGAAWPVLSFIKKFRSHFDAYLAKNPQHAAGRDLKSLTPAAFM